MRGIMEEIAINMYKIDEIAASGKAQALQIFHEGKAYSFRHLFSQSQRWEPVEGRRERTERRGEHSHPLHHVLLYTEGRGHFNYCGGTPSFEPGTLVVSSPGEPHCFGPHDDCGEPVTYKHFTFELISGDSSRLEAPFHKLLSLYSGAEYGESPFPLKLDPFAFHSVLESMESAIALRMEHETHPNLGEAAAIMRLFATIARELRPSGSGVSRVIDERLLKAKTLLVDDSLGNIRMERLSKEAGLSGPHLIRSFKAAFGETPMRFNRRLRLERARQLLAESGWGEKRIASETGFCDEFHFAKSFKSLYGEAPSAFRRRALSERA